MEVLLVLIPFVVVGILVIFVAFSGGPRAAREAYLTGGRRWFAASMLFLYLGLGVAVPAAVIASRGASEGAVGKLRTEQPTSLEEEGKRLFIQTCATCHNLDAVNARGVTGPDLDELGGLDEQRVLSAIENGGTGQGRMPADLLEGENARAVARYVSRVAGQ
ncbi:MAG TPA: cytochrome c [Thermoleophilaceae bacterium]|nr:cytochrome c [Thermoleophilaceae bacterium]